MNPLIPMLRQGSNGPHIDHVQSDYERLEDWRMRMLKYAGIEPTRKPYRVIFRPNTRPVWILITGTDTPELERACKTATIKFEGALTEQDVRKIIIPAIQKGVNNDL